MPNILIKYQNYNIHNLLQWNFPKTLIKYASLLVCICQCLLEKHTKQDTKIWQRTTMAYAGHPQSGEKERRGCLHPGARRAHLKVWSSPQCPVPVRIREQRVWDGRPKSLHRKPGDVTQGEGKTGALLKIQKQICPFSFSFYPIQVTNCPRVGLPDPKVCNYWASLVELLLFKLTQSINSLWSCLWTQRTEPAFHIQTAIGSALSHHLSPCWLTVSMSVRTSTWNNTEPNSDSNKSLFFLHKR